MPASASDIAAASRDVVTARWTDAAIDARGALIGVERRRFAVTAFDLVWPDPATGIPCVRLIDAEQGVDGAFLVARIEVDLDAETTSLELFG